MSIIPEEKYCPICRETHPEYAEPCIGLNPSNSTMTAQEISDVLDTLKVNSRGYIRAKNPAINKLQSMHLKKVDSTLMDIRIYVAKISTGHTTREVLKMIDEFIYQKQIK